MTVVWRKSSHSSDGTTSQCVELAQLTNAIGIRDSNDPGGGHLVLAPETFVRLVQHIKGLD
ncbi:DUF397 domain-containing protein [Actinomadura livida]|uniref:DUF397 domain-containing protein n=1 Tax=Actinomadura livida TaxID=79909 RepID=A0A7W7I8H6_9ACTN|nr:MULTISPECIES: DUF397 domain-containing protein [Actinomadura]MBB4772349.1 hypothetical protein [Actinomadura catellatispora]GGU23598.1 hypothetical protein GCM10010208_55870 [Actinomadura livida]